MSPIAEIVNFDLNLSSELLDFEKVAIFSWRGLRVELSCFQENQVHR